MIAYGEARDAVVGTWQILRAEPNALRSFDCSADGFFRSFAAIVAIAPMILIGLAAERQMMILQGTETDEGFPTVLFALAQFGALAINWFGFPLFLAAIAAPIGLSDRFVPYVVVRNWSSILGLAPIFLVDLLALTGAMSVRGFATLKLFAFAFNFFVSYRVARAAAGVAVGGAIGLVVLEFLFALLVGSVASRLAGL
jgi:hypothetical protein